ncbi:hypothetical protein ACFPVY_10095 [Flavobacterium qiangtangense]|uniref:Outer membrane protein with beta-barrel domain n=1 Tax=Flavobacterium qiangtangense TaxID=1442595 RepID=A0ABW1PP21_9FLAO
MQKIIFYAVAMLCLFASKVFAQETFETRAKAIAQNIETVTKEEKDALKSEVEAVNKQLDNGEITQEQADARKEAYATIRANNIETKVAAEEAKLTALVKEKVDGKVSSGHESTQFGIFWKSNTTKSDADKQKQDSIYRTRSDRRTTSQLVFATGFNNTINEGDLGTLNDSDFKFNKSQFYEWGITFNSRLAKNSNLLHAKYGLSLMYNNLRATDNRSFVVNGDQTELVENPIHLKESRFRNVYLVLPLHLEFDFTKKKIDGDKVYFRSHESFRFGIGGYAGVNVKSKQILRYEVDDREVKERTKGDFNVNNFVYGLSAYVGYGQMSLYAKYDLSPLFKDNVVDQNNVSLGLRFDLN